MEELSTEEMTSLRGGARAHHHAQSSISALSFGNVAVAIPIDITVLSGNAVGRGATAGVGDVSQIGDAKAGLQLFNF